MSPFLRVFRAASTDLELAMQGVEEVQGRAPVDESALARFLTDPTCYMILAVEGNRVVGSLHGYALHHPHRPEPQFLLYEIAVRPECRRRGIGRSLLAAFGAEARAAGAFEQWVLTNESNLPAMAMYQRCGYRRVNFDDIMLTMALCPDAPR